MSVSLRPEDVKGFVFWTKNVGPFLGHLAEVRRRGFPFVVQHTITGYPRVLEQAVVGRLYRGAFGGRRKPQRPLKPTAPPRMTSATVSPHVDALVEEVTR